MPGRWSELWIACVVLGVGCWLVGQTAGELGRDGGVGTTAPELDLVVLPRPASSGGGSSGPLLSTTPGITATPRPAATSTPAGMEADAAARAFRIRSEWLKSISVNDTGAITVTVAQSTAGGNSSGGAARVEHVPLAVGTPGRPIAEAFGTGAEVYAVTRLTAPGFDAVSGTAGERRLQSVSTWNWLLTPKSTGQHRANVTVDLEWRFRPPAGILEEPREPERHQLWTDTLDIAVSTRLFPQGLAGPLGELGSKLSAVLITPGVLGLIGSRLLTAAGGLGPLLARFTPVRHFPRRRRPGQPSSNASDDVHPTADAAPVDAGVAGRTTVLTEP